MGRGIDYGMGTTNINPDTGIRFGVISQHAVTQAWADSSEPEYGPPCCPSCGCECLETCGDVDSALNDEQRKRIEMQYPNGLEKDYLCPDCGVCYWSDHVWGAEPNGFRIDDGEYLATQSRDDSDIFVIKSPYYTRAAFCSPCAPGACYLTSPCDDGEKAYCFGPDWFDEDIEPCPYPVYRVDNDELIYSPATKDGAE
jgi:hypothetical protein